MAELNNYLVIATAWALYYSLHSILATNDVKSALLPFFKSSKTYRLLYSFISLIGLLLIFKFILATPISYILEPSGWLRYTGMVLGAWGAIILSLGFKNFSGLAFLGLKKESLDALITHGIHSQMRHPLYTGTILIFSGMFLFIPSISFFISLLLLCAYLPIGIRLEEKKLISQFGEEYLEYKRKVKALTPWF